MRNPQYILDTSSDTPVPTTCSKSNTGGVVTHEVSSIAHILGFTTVTVSKGGPPRPFQMADLTITKESRRFFGLRLWALLTFQTSTEHSRLADS